MMVKPIDEKILVNLGFIKNTRMSRHYRYHIPESKFFIIFYVDARNEPRYGFWHKDDSAVKFEYILENCPESFKDILLFNLDLFV